MTRENRRFTHLWGDKIKEYNKRVIGNQTTYEPLNVTNPEIIDGVQKELNYVWELDEVKALIMYADEATLSIQKGEEAIRDPLSSTPVFNLYVDKRDENGTPVQKTLIIRRQDKFCTLHFFNVPNGEIMAIGENKLDSEYNEAIYGWVGAGMKLLKNALGENKHILRISIQEEYTNFDTFDNIDIEDPLSVTSENSEEKGPMEL